MENVKTVDELMEKLNSLADEMSGKKKTPTAAELRKAENYRRAFWEHMHTGLPQNDLKEVLRILRPASSFLLIADIYGGYEFDQETLTNIRQFDLFNPTPDEFRDLFLNAGFSGVNIHLKDGTSWICAEGIK